MPPRLPLLLRALRPQILPSNHIGTSHALAPIFLAPSTSAPHSHQRPQQSRSASILSSLSDTPGAYSKRIRRGRGPASGKGKTSGRGHKGQKQHGKVPFGFNGGQTPDIVVSGTRGYDNQFSLDMSPINLNRIQSWIDQGRLNPAKPITLKELVSTRCIHGIKDGVKLLARDATALRIPIHIVVSRASATAIAAVEAAGGSVTTRYYTKASIRRVLKGESHPFISRLSAPPADAEAAADAASKAVEAEAAPKPRGPIAEAVASAAAHEVAARYRYRLPDPAGRKDLEYYRNPAHRGYLSYALEEGRSPSLFWRTPGVKVAKKVSKKKIAVGDMLW
ncbi:ribosomal protein L15 [Trichodelitschia bisporula]|uniref:Ribosomal protein L15 n=1 Tax=Trichodelitschia bisporula TaxID=703511 RepID=A0A6G1HPM6_9PEZI|nr:ribosomal protein L15 [Trichodelitschia bisporula]